MFTDRRHIVWRELLRLLPYTIVGALIGLYYFNAFDGRSLARGLGAVVLAYGCFGVWGSLRSPVAWKLPSRLTLPVTGTLAGIVGALFGAMAGVFYAIYFDLQRVNKEQFRATVAATLLVLGFVRGGGYLVVGAYDREALIATVFSLPLMFAGVVLGNHIHVRLSESAFRRLIGIVLIVSGIPLLLG